MRVNIYNEELTGEIKVVETKTDTGNTYYGVRIFFASPDALHHTKQDDDRSAVTIWVGKQGLARQIKKALQPLIVKAIPAPKPKPAEAAPTP